MELLHTTHHSFYRTFFFVVLAVALHVLFYSSVRHISDGFFAEQKQKIKNARQVPVKFKTLPKDAEIQKFVETNLKPTEKPVDAKFLGKQDHIAKKETKMKRSMNALDRSGSKESLSSRRKGSLAKKAKQPRKTRKGYGKYLPQVAIPSRAVALGGIEDLTGVPIDFSGTIDLSTVRYTLAAFHVQFRRNLELAWTYPAEALRKRQTGTAIVEFLVHKTGKVSDIKVKKSSGYEILDKTVVDTLQLISYSQKLPKDFEKSYVKLAWRFQYGS